MTSTIKVDTISENTSANGVTIDGLTIKDGNIIGDVALAGTTPTFTIGDAGAEDASLIFDGNAQDFYIALDDSADDLVIGTGSTVGSNVKMVIENGGNVGIGETSPGSLLHVKASDTGIAPHSSAQITLEREGTNYLQFLTAETGTSGILFGDGSDTDVGKIIYDHNVPTMQFFVETSEAMRIDSSGRLGIGTSSPKEKLDVSGAGVFTGTHATGTNAYGAAQGVMIHATGSSGFVSAVSNGSNDVDLQLRALNGGSANANQLVLDSEGNVGIGTSSPSQLLDIVSSDNAPLMEIRSSVTPDGSKFGGGIILGLSQANDSGSGQPDTQAGDTLGRIVFEGQGTDYTYNGAEISTVVTVGDGNDGRDNQATALVIKTIGVGGNSSAETVRFSATENVFNEASADTDFRVESNNNTNMMFVDAGDDRTHFGGTTHNGHGLGVHNFYGGTTTDQPNLIISSNADAYTDDQIHTGCMRTGTSAWFIARHRSGNASNDAFNDTEFSIRGDGNAFCDGSFSGGGADYAEYFEWKDGNSSDEDRVGYSVVLDGNKIVKATDSDDTSKIIGVISGNPTIVGDNDIDRWKQKYLKDDFGRYIFEDYTITRWTEIVEDGDDIKHSYATDRIPEGITAPSDATVISTEKNKYGETVNFFRKKTNPDWDEDTAYVSREDRKEWDTVGLMGKLKLRKGQPTGINWIKMRDISDSVEEWLVK